MLAACAAVVDNFYMSFVKDTISRVGEIVGNVLNHSFSQNADKQLPMPNLIDTEIALHGSRPAKNEGNTPRARLRAQVPTNVRVKTQIFDGDYEGEPYEVC